MRDTVARALCRKNSDEPCKFCTIEAGIALVALAEAGYLRAQSSPTAEDYVRATALAVGVDPDEAVAAFPQTDDGAGASPAATSADPLDPTAQAGQTNGTPAPSSPLPRRFELYRHSDITGLTGTGVVAWGAQWPDGTASLRWGGKHPSTVAWANVERIIAVHGHQGSTELRWLDGGS